MAILTESGVELEPYQIVLRPLVTEKGTHISTRYNSYVFEVNKLATKLEIRQAVESLWNVRVVSIRTQNRVGKPRRTRTGETTTPDW